MQRLSNAEVAALFREMAELLKIRGGDPHRVRAYGRVARVLENLPEPLERMLRFGTLSKQAWIGPGTVERIKQILRTGTCDDLEKLRAALPPGLRELMRLKGLGPSTVRLLFQRYRIQTLDELEQAIHSGLLARLPRFGVDRIHNILREVEGARRRRGKVPLYEALETVDRIAAELRDAGALEATCGGSVRRRKAMIGDLDLLAAADDPRPLVERFTSLASAEDVLSSGNDAASIRLPTGQQADLWVFPLESWGAGLHAFSGSKEHVVALRTRAGRRGLHISEHGISHRTDGRRLSSGRTEEEIFAAVGLPWLEPEHRLGLNEIELADAGRLPRLIRDEDLRGDLHMHTDWSDGDSPPQAMIHAGADLGYEYLAITDHSKSLTVARGLDEERLQQQVRQLRDLEQQIGRLYVLAGSEVDILEDGSLDLDPKVLRGLDWVVASVHEHHDMDAATMTARIIRAIESGVVDCIGHPTGRRLGRREPYPLDLDRVIDAARRAGVALEANGGPRRMDLDDLGCRQAREQGVWVAVNTDAHSPGNLAKRDFALASARRGWLEKRHVLNAQPLDTIRDLRADRLRREGLAVSVPRTIRLTAETEETPAPNERAAALQADKAAALAERLQAAGPDNELADRLERYMADGTDTELAAALALLSDNPLQEAFNRLMALRG